MGWGRREGGTAEHSVLWITVELNGHHGWTQIDGIPLHVWHDGPDFDDAALTEMVPASSSPNHHALAWRENVLLRLVLLVVQGN